MSAGQSLNALTARILTDIAPVLKADSPDIVLVHGDTTNHLRDDAGGVLRTDRRRPCGGRIADW